MPTALEDARDALARGGLVVYPTDTLYGLGCLAADGAAFERLEAVKGLPQRRGVSVVFATLDEARAWSRWTPLADALAAAFLPGPLTLVVDAKGAAPAHLLGEAGTLGVRLVDRPETLALAAVGPVVSTSANRHGEPAITRVDQARAQFGRDVDAYVDVGPLEGPPSTVVDARGGRPKVIREGSLARAIVEEVDPDG